MKNLKTKTINLSLPEELLKDIDRAAKAESRTRSDFLRESVRQRVLKRDLDELNASGRVQATKLGLTIEDVPRLVKEVRAEMFQEQELLATK